MYRMLLFLLVAVFLTACSGGSGGLQNTALTLFNAGADLSDSKTVGLDDAPLSTGEAPFMSSFSPAVTPTLMPTPVPTPGDGRIIVAEGFYFKPLDEKIIAQITGSSYPEKPQDDITYDMLNHVKVLHYNFEGEVCEGELIVASDLAEEVTQIFYQLYLAKYPITSIKLIDAFGGSTGDRASMSANNTSAFNYRVVAGTNKLSNHAFGRAIDINPMMNPYVKGSHVSPENGADYADRSNIRTGMIDDNDLCYRLFTENGWTWGGGWSSVKDYQHFEK